MTGWMFDDHADGTPARAAQLVYTAIARLIAVTPLGLAHTYVRRARSVDRTVRYRRESAGVTPLKARSSS